MSTRGKVLMAMSGGVDSTVAALLLRDAGYDVVGITMKTWDYQSAGTMTKETGCCNLDTIHDAREIAVRFGFPHYVLDLKKEFEEKIIRNFIDEYLAGRTPNPCVLCNTHIKWDILWQRADQFDCEYIATGHYARIAQEDGRFFLRRSNDKEKDQTYVLWGLSQNNLMRTKFPLGDYTKAQVREIARDYGLQEISRKAESYEICFIPDNDYRSFLKFRVSGLEQKVNGGDFVTTDGRILGKHKGYPFYTIGQRKGLNVAVGYPLYVNRIIAAENKVVLGTREELNRTELIASDINRMKYLSLDGLNGIQTFIRYNDKGTTASLSDDGSQIRVKFDKPVQAIAPGQSVVFYENDDLIGGGIISE